MRILISLIICGLLLSSCLSNRKISARSDGPKLLVFTKTLGWRHASIPAGKEAMQELGAENNWTIDFSEDSLLFTREYLAEIDLVVFLNTTGDILGDEQEVAFQNFIEGGGSFFGIHSAADTECDWEWYVNLVGACFESHPNDPNVLPANILRSENEHVCTAHLPNSWPRSDEWYNYKMMNPAVTPLLMLDETSYVGGNQGDFHPIAWHHNVGEGTAIYTGGGHTKESYSEPLFVEHLQLAMKFLLEESKSRSR